MRRRSSAAASELCGAPEYSWKSATWGSADHRQTPAQARAPQPAARVHAPLPERRRSVLRPPKTQTSMSDDDLAWGAPPQPRRRDARRCAAPACASPAGHPVRRQPAVTCCHLSVSLPRHPLTRRRLVRARGGQDCPGDQARRGGRGGAVASQEARRGACSRAQHSFRLLAGSPVAQATCRVCHTHVAHQLGHCACAEVSPEKGGRQEGGRQERRQLRRRPPRR